MDKLVLLFAAAALLSDGCRSANIERHLKMLPKINNDIEPSVAASKPTGLRKFLSLTDRPAPLSALTPGAPLALTCEALASPAPTIHWYKNDAPVYEYDQESNEILDTGSTSVGRLTSTLLVSRAEGHDEYTCLAVSGANTARASTVVYSIDGSTDLTERSKLTPLAPRILVSYKVYLDTFGSNVVLPCHARGHPKPHISWSWRNNNGQLMKLNSRMKSSRGPGPMQVLRSGALLISRLRWDDLGEYSCEAANAFGSHVARTFVYPARAG